MDCRDEKCFGCTGTQGDKSNDVLEGPKRRRVYGPELRWADRRWWARGGSFWQRTTGWMGPERAPGTGFGNEPRWVGWGHAGAVAAKWRCRGRAAAGSGGVFGPETRRADGECRWGPKSPKSVWVSGSRTRRKTCRWWRVQRGGLSDGLRGSRSRPG